MTTTTTTNAPPQVIWVYRYREDDVDSLNDVLSSGLITHVFIKLLHRDDMKISRYGSHEYKVPLAIARCQEFGIPVIFCRNLWPSWDLQIYETGTQGQWSSQNPEHLEGDIVIHNKIVSGIIRKIYYKANKDTSEEPGTGDDWDELSPKDFAEGVWYNSDFYENEIRELKLDVSSGGIAEGADYISLDVEAYASALVWFQTKGGSEHLSSEEQKNAIATAIATAIAAEGKVDYTFPAGSNQQDGDHVPAYYAALGNIRICQHTYYDREVPVNILYDWEMFGAYINTQKRTLQTLRLSII